VPALLDAVSRAVAGAALSPANRARESRGVSAPTVDVESAPHRPAVAEHLPDALVVRVAAFVVAVAPAVIVPWVVVEPEPEQPVEPAQWTSTVAVLVAESPASRHRPSVPPSPAVERLAARQPPPVVVQAAEPSVFCERAATSFDAAPDVVEAAVFVAACEVLAPVRLDAEPVHPVAPSEQRVPASAVASRLSRSSPVSTLLDVPQPPVAAVQRAVALPSRLSSRFPAEVDATACVAPAGSPSPVARTLPDVELSHVPVPVSHEESAPWRVAAVFWPHSPAVIEHFAVALLSPLVELLLQSRFEPLIVQDAEPLLSPDVVATEQPEEIPATATQRSWSFLPSASRLTEPHLTNAPFAPHPAVEPSPPETRVGTSGTSSPTADIRSSVAS
jgi:hypothetical protein